MRRILYIEDNDDNLALLKLRLEIAGFDVLAAIDGREGVALACSEKPDLVLMDLDLPGIDGWEATRQLRRDAATCDIPVIALSAHAMPNHLERAMAAGCDEYETKPVDFARLLGKVERLLALKGH